MNVICSVFYYCAIFIPYITANKRSFLRHCLIIYLQPWYTLKLQFCVPHKRHVFVLIKWSTDRFLAMMASTSAVGKKFDSLYGYLYSLIRRGDIKGLGFSNIFKDLNEIFLFQFMHLSRFLFCEWFYITIAISM